MFNKQNFCHVASNNRNEQKAGIFVYKTTDSLATITVSGYFNEKLVDINLHDLIIHEQTDHTDKTKVKYNILAVIERTLDNVGTKVIKRDWDTDIETAIETLRQYVDNTFVKLDGTSIMTGPLKMRATQDFKCAIAPYWDGVGFFKLNDNDSVTLMASLEYQDSFTPAENNVYNIGSTSKKWKNLYLAGKAYMSVINNGYDIAVPVTNSADTLALKSEVDLAANSGRMLTDQGVWYAKMYAASTVPTGAEYDGRNYADFSQVDSDNNPIIVIYEGQSGAWVQTETITPPAEYDGYVPVTSKIWDIAEQSGQQGGRVLWNHQSKDFTPYPQIISFENAALTGVPTAPLPTAASPNNQIATKEYVDSHSSTGGYHPDLFDWKWADALRDDVQWLRADTFSWQNGSVYEAAFNELFYDIQISTYWYGGGGPAYTKSRTPAGGDAVYLNSDLTTQIGTVEAYDDVNDTITVSGNTYSFMSNTYVTPTSETVAGYTVSVYTGHSGRKITIPSYETAVSNIYSATGVAWYYIIDVPNKRFKLPRGKHSKYSETNQVTTTDTNYTAGSTPMRLGTVGTSTAINRGSANPIATYGDNGIGTNAAGGSWGSQHEKLAPINLIINNEQDTDQYKYLYFYVGEFTQTAIENTAGINAEDFNGKADNDFGNTNMIDYVVAKQEPSAGNNYTWYRKYKSGWVEQGGYLDGSTSYKTTEFTLPVQMSDSHYTITSQTENLEGPATLNGQTSTGFCIYERVWVDSWYEHNFRGYWTVSGMAA